MKLYDKKYPYKNVKIKIILFCIEKSDLFVILYSFLSIIFLFN